MCWDYLLKMLSLKMISYILKTKLSLTIKNTSETKSGCHRILGLHAFSAWKVHASRYARVFAGKWRDHCETPLITRSHLLFRKEKKKVLDPSRREWANGLAWTVCTFTRRFYVIHELQLLPFAAPLIVVNLLLARCKASLSLYNSSTCQCQCQWRIQNENDQNFLR